MAHACSHDHRQRRRDHGQHNQSGGDADNLLFDGSSKHAPRPEPEKAQNDDFLCCTKAVCRSRLGLTPTWYTEDFAELATPSCTLAIGSKRTMELFGAGAARPADNHSAIIEFRVDDVAQD